MYGVVGIALGSALGLLIGLLIAPHVFFPWTSSMLPTIPHRYVGTVRSYTPPELALTSRATNMQVDTADAHWYVALYEREKGYVATNTYQRIEPPTTIKNGTPIEVYIDGNNIHTLTATYVRILLNE